MITRARGVHGHSTPDKPPRGGSGVPTENEGPPFKSLYGLQRYLDEHKSEDKEERRRRRRLARICKSIKSEHYTEA